MNVRIIPPYASSSRFEEIGITKKLINIDSRFRRYTDITEPTDYRYMLPIEEKNIISIQVSSVELPNTYYSISSKMNTNSFNICYAGDTINVNISDGNYDINQLMDAILTSIQSSGLGNWSLSFDEITGKFTITETNSLPFTMNFDPNNLYPKRTRDFGLGYFLGFRKKYYEGYYTYTSEGTVNLYGDTYLFLKVNDYDVIYNRSREKEMYGGLAKIIIDSNKNTYVFDNHNFITKRYVFQQPVNIQYVDIKLMNSNGDIIDLKDQDWSFTLEIEVIENSHLYEQYRRHFMS